MWKATIGHEVKVEQNGNADDWETDPDFVNDIDEKESRWGAKTIEGSGHQASVRLDELRQNVVDSDRSLKQKQLDEGPKASEGYGGKFGVQQDRMDKTAESFEYKGEVPKHVSQKDYSQGFGGKYGVQSDRIDKSAVGWEHREQLAQHESQKDFKTGFGGKYGVQKDRQDKSAVGWEHREDLAKHESQKDYTRGFGGKYGVQDDRKDESAVGWDYQEKLSVHESQKDYAKGFGGKYGVQTELQDKTAVGWDHQEKLSKHESQQDYSKGFGGKYGVQADHVDKSALGFDAPERERGPPRAATKPEVPAEKGMASSLKSRFEQLAVQDEESHRRRLTEQQERRKQEDLRHQEELKRMEEERQKKLREQNDDRTPSPEPAPALPSSPPPIIEQSVAAAAIRSGPSSDVPPFVAPEERISQDYTPQTAPTDSVIPSSVPATGVYILPPRSDHPIQSKRRESELEEPKPNHHAPAAVEQDYGAGDTYGAYNEAGTTDQLQPSSVVADPLGAMSPSSPTTAAMEPATYEEFAEQPSSGPPGAAIEEGLATDHPLAPPTHPMADTGIKAVALYDYQAGDVDEISFEPDDIITNIDMVDEGWWRGNCRGQYGLFPANYVELCS